MRDPQRLFLANGILRKAIMAGGWLPLALRLVVELEFSALQLLLMGTAIELAILLGEVPTGVVADVFSRKWSVIIGGLLLHTAQLASGFADEWVLYLGTQFLWGFGWTFISGAEIAWVTDEVGTSDDVEPLLLRRGRLEFVATIVGLVFFGLLSQVVSLGTAVMVAGAMGLVWNLLLASMMRETGFQRSNEEHWSTFVSTMRLGARFTWQTKGLRILGIALIAGGMAAEAMDRLDVRRLQDLGLSTDASPTLVFGIVMTAQSLIAGIALWRFEQRFAGRRVVTAFATLLGLVGLASLALAHIPVLALAAVLLIAQGGMLDLTQPLIGTWANALAPDGARATVHSFIGQTRAFGEIIGGVTLGAVAEVFTLPTAWTVGAGLFLFAAAICWSARPHSDGLTPA